MAKKKRNKNRHIQSRRSKPAVEKQAYSGAKTVTRKIPEIPAFWVAIIIPVICLVGAWTFPPVATPMELKSYTSQIYLSGLLLLWLWMQRKNLIFTLTFSPARIAFGLLFVFGTLSLLWANNPDFWVYKWNKWFAGFVMFLLGLHITQNEKNLDTIINLVILGGLITALLGISQYLFGLNVIPQTSFPSSTFGNGNMAGQVMVLAALLPLYFLFKENLSKGKTWYYAITMALLLAYAYYTRTRAVWLSLGIEVFLLALFLSLDSKKSGWLHWRREKTMAGCAALTLFAVMVNVNQNGFQPFWEIAVAEIASIATSVGSSAEQGEHRYLIWAAVLEMARENPVIGTGLGSFFHNYNTGGFANYNIMGVQRVHNDVFELGVELGIVGLLLLLGIIITVCISLYKLIMHCEGQKRILMALLTIAVTGSMANAQVSFPYQLPVPLVIMPFYMALIIRGAELVAENTFTVQVSKWFPKTALGASAVVFTFIVINDAAWFRDIHTLNRIVAGELKNTPWQPVNPIFNQAYITGSRSVNQALTRVNRNQEALLIIQPLLEYWPDVASNTLLAAENNMKLGNHEEAVYWSEKTVASQPEGAYIGEYYLMNVYMMTGDMDNLKALYEALKAEPENLLSKQASSYNMLHSMSINTGDFDMTQHYFDKYLEYHGEHQQVIANHAVFHINTGNIPAAIPYIEQALALNPNNPLADRFRQILSEYTGE